MSEKNKGERITVRVTPDVKRRITKIVEERGLPEAEIIRECVKALCDFYEEHGVLIFPLEVRPKGYAFRKLYDQLVAEDPPEYKSGKKSAKQKKKTS